MLGGQGQATETRWLFMLLKEPKIGTSQQQWLQIIMQIINQIMPTRQPLGRLCPALPRPSNAWTVCRLLG